MDTMKKALLDSVHKAPALILRKILTRKVIEAGVELPPDGMKALIDHIMETKNGNFVWPDSSSDRSWHLDLTFNDEDAKEAEASMALLTTTIPDAILKGVDEAGKGIFKNLCARWDVEYHMQQEEILGFKDRLEELWGEGLSYLRMLLTCCREIGLNTSKRHAKSKSIKLHYRRWVMVRLHTRACQITDEIICLMSNGFADGAMARWRTIHELSVIATLISGGDEELAQRYILHDSVEVKRQADNFDTTHMELGFLPIKKNERKRIEDKYKAAIDNFGQEFGHPYGWAAKHLKLKKPTFKDLEAAAERSAMSSYYKLASFNVHASARSLFFNHSSMGQVDILNAGRSNAGLLEPASRVSHTVVLITSLYAENTGHLGRLAELSGLIHLRDAVVPAFQRAEQTLKKRVQSLQSNKKKTTA
jgi:hypothetical protein